MYAQVVPWGNWQLTSDLPFTGLRWVLAGRWLWEGSAQPGIQQPASPLLCCRQHPAPPCLSPPYHPPISQQQCAGRLDQGQRADQWRHLPRGGWWYWGWVLGRHHSSAPPAGQWPTHAAAASRHPLPSTHSQDTLNRRQSKWLSLDTAVRGDAKVLSGPTNDGWYHIQVGVWRRWGCWVGVVGV